MASLMEVPFGNAANVDKGLAEDLQERAATQPPNRRATAVEKVEDPRFRGKSIDDVVDMYRNLESHSGRLANEVGSLRQQVSTIIDDKRKADLEANVPKKLTVKTEDLLQNPTEVLNSLIQTEVSRALKPTTDGIARLEATLSGAMFSGAHRDADDITRTPEFADWVRKTPLRQNLASLASRGDMNAANTLLTEYKETSLTRATSATEAGQRAAERVSFERSSTAVTEPAQRKPGKVYKRADIQAWRMAHPDPSDDQAAEIDKLYLEGRVID